jgi:hypothetical protein
MAKKASDRSKRDVLLSKPPDKHGEKRYVCKNQNSHFRRIHVTALRYPAEIDIAGATCAGFQKKESYWKTKQQPLEFQN